MYIQRTTICSPGILSGLSFQLTDFQSSAAPATLPPPDTQEKWLQDDQLHYFKVLRDRKRKKDLTDAINKANKPKALKAIYLDDKKLSELEISPDGRFITYSLFTAPAGAKATFVPSFVTESGFTSELPSRTKVGAPRGSYRFFIFDRERDTILALQTDQIPGITDLPDYLKDYPTTAGRQKDAAAKDGPKKDAANNNASSTAAPADNLTNQYSAIARALLPEMGQSCRPRYPLPELLRSWADVAGSWKQEMLRLTRRQRDEAA